MTQPADEQLQHARQLEAFEQLCEQLAAALERLETLDPVALGRDLGLPTELLRSALAASEGDALSAAVGALVAARQALVAAPFTGYGDEVEDVLRRLAGEIQAGT
jgi:hypothetical protein